MVGQWVCKRADTRGKAEYEEDRRIDTQGNSGIAAFDTRQGIATDEGALGDDSHCQSASFASSRNILPELRERLADRQRRCGMG